VKIGNNTQELFVDGARCIVLHATTVLRFRANGDIVLDSGGWRTATTKDRINKYLPAPWRVRQVDGSWFLHNLDACTSWFFEDNTTIDAEGRVWRAGRDHPVAPRNTRTNQPVFDKGE